MQSNVIAERVPPLSKNLCFDNRCWLIRLCVYAFEATSIISHQEDWTMAIQLVGESFPVSASTPL